MKRWIVLLGCLVAIIFGTAVVCKANDRHAKYNGVVIFDRWDACTIYRGCYIMYVSEKVKEGLRKYAGQAIHIDVMEAYREINDDDDLILKFKYLGPAIPNDQHWADGIHLESSVKVREDGKPVATIIVQNVGSNAVTLYSRELTFTLLKKRDVTNNSWDEYGPHFAAITRQGFMVDTDPRWEGTWAGAHWTIGKENVLPGAFTLGVGEIKQINVQFDLSDGEYDFICGYGYVPFREICLASHLSAFDVKGGKAKIVEIKPR